MFYEAHVCELGDRGEETEQPWELQCGHSNKDGLHRAQGLVA